MASADGKPSGARDIGVSDERRPTVTGMVGRGPAERSVAYTGVRETTWVTLPAAEIRAIAQDIGAIQTTPLPVVVGGPRPVVLSAHLPAVHQSYARQMFRVNDDADAESELIYAITAHPGAVLADRCGISIPTDFVGCYDPASRVCLFLGDASVGLLRSVVFGVASRVHVAAGYVPAHGALVDVGGGAALIAGGHNSGKSTTLMAVLAQVLPADGVAVWTDDWAVYRTGELGTEGVPLDRRIELNPGIVGTYLQSSASPYERARISGTHVAYVDPAAVFPGLSHTGRAWLGTVLLLRDGGGPKSAEDVVRVPPRTAVEQLVAESYHMPDDAEVAATARSFWQRALRSIPCYAIDLDRRGGRYPDPRRLAALLRTASTAPATRPRESVRTHHHAQG